MRFWMDCCHLAVSIQILSAACDWFSCLRLLVKSAHRACHACDQTTTAMLHDLRHHKKPVHKSQNLHMNYV